MKLPFYIIIEKEKNEKSKKKTVKFSISINFLADREDDGPPQSQVDAPASDYQQPPPNTYAFPPNSNSFYPPPSPQRPISVPSYLPPASGPTNYPIYPGPLAPKEAVSSLHTQVDNSGSVDSMSGINDMNDNDMNGAPAPSSPPGKDDASMDNGNPDRPSDDTKLIDKPPANFIPNKKPDFPSLSFLDQDSHEHDHDHHHYIDDHPPSHDHHFHDHDSFSPYDDDSLKHLHGFDAFPGNFIGF